MQQITLQRAIEIALQHHQAGRLAEAETIYRQILNQTPNQPAALHLLGVVAHQVGKHEAAVNLIRQAIAITPNEAAFHSNLGEAYRSLRRFDEAAAALTRAIELNRDYADAHNNLGNVSKDRGQLEEAADAYLKAIQIKPDFAEAYYNLGNVRSAQKRLDEAAGAYRTAIQLRPSFIEAHSRLGGILSDQGKPDEAISFCMMALRIKPDFAEAHFHLGNALGAREKWEDAAAAYTRAIQLKPNDGDAYYNLGNTLRSQGKFEPAIAALTKASQLKPDYFGIYNNLGNIYQELGQLDEAAASYSRAIALKPDSAEAFNNLGTVLTLQGKLDEAVEACSRAIALQPGNSAAYNNLGRALKDQGLIDQALAAYERAMNLDSADVVYHSNRVYALHLHPDFDAAAIHGEHRKWNQIHAAALTRQSAPHLNTMKAPNARLKIGYVSPDFSVHPVGRFLLPLLEYHDRGSFEIHCYSDVHAPDVMTERLRSHTDVWRNIVGMSDQRVAELIRQDGIDILVDLAMHTAHNRLLVFARKPAPVQVTYLAYCSTTGLDAMDYRFTDPHLDPFDAAQGGPLEKGDEFYSEKSIRLPETYWCYDPPAQTPEPGPPPAIASGHVTFGCLNNFAKASMPVLLTWRRLLRDVPQSRLLLHAREGSHRRRVVDLLQQEGVDPTRLTFASFVHGPKYFELYQKIDIALDPFPCAGGTTTCDALWMGVPVLTLAGQTAVGRLGVSMLSNVGLNEWIAHSQDEYVNLATNFAADLPGLAQVRAGLRQRMETSPLMDAPRFAARVETAYREMWTKWRAGSSGS